MGNTPHRTGQAWSQSFKLTGHLSCNRWTRESQALSGRKLRIFAGITLISERETAVGEIN